LRKGSGRDDSAGGGGAGAQAAIVPPAAMAVVFKNVRLLMSMLAPSMILAWNGTRQSVLGTAAVTA
jgi:hypothetical protein